MKRSILVLVAALLLCGSSFAQQWSFDSFVKPELLGTGGGANGVVVDPDGNIWVAAYNTASVDTFLNTPTGTWHKGKALYIIKTDGSVDTMFHATNAANETWVFLGASNIGLNKDFEGNILLSNNSRLLKIDYKTRALLGAVIPPTTNIMKPAVDSMNNVYIGHVVGGPITKYAPDLTNPEVLIATTGGIGRTLEVSKDGLTIYQPRYTLHSTVRFSKPDEFSPYVADTLLIGMDCESNAWDPVMPNHMWMSAGSWNDRPRGQWVGRENTHYLIDVTTLVPADTNLPVLVDSILTVVTDIATPANQRPRGIALTADGKTAYTTYFGGINDTILHKHVNPLRPVSVEKENNFVASNYQLAQNYPNPFNPSTKINFSVVNPGMVTLKVYNVIGAEVATLVNEFKSNGNYTVNFDAKNLPSGNYVYELKVDNVRIAKKMTLLK